MQFKVAKERLDLMSRAIRELSDVCQCLSQIVHNHIVQLSSDEYDGYVSCCHTLEKLASDL